MSTQGRHVAVAVAPVRSWTLAARARRCGVAALVAICAQWSAVPVPAHAGFVHAGSTEPARDSITTVAPGAGYDEGWFYRIFWGDHWRDAWTTEIRVPVLDLETYAGGLTPVSAGGRMQTKSLWLTGANGKPYAFRSVYKYAANIVPEVFRGTFVEQIAQDQMSTQYPAGALVADSLLSAAGVLHARPELVMLPDDASLGEFREDFAGELGLLQERPAEDAAALATFAGAEEIVDCRDLIERAHENPAYRVDSRAFLTARLMDIFLGDWDRHPGQWKWADFGADSTPGWRPIAEDRDQVFARITGLLPGFARTRFPDLSSFGRRYDDVVRLHYTARFLDRLFLTELERPAWDSASADLTSLLTDEVIAGAVERLPPGLQTVNGEYLRTALESRRDDLSKIAGEFYELLARQPYVFGTNASEIVEIEGEYGAVLVTLRDSEPGSEPYLRRRFLRGETEEIRLYLWGGDDRVVVRGASRLPILVRIIGGTGDDEYDFVTPARNIKLYDDSGTNRVVGTARGVRINGGSYDPPTLVPASGAPPPPRHWGSQGFPTMGGGFSPDYGLIVGGGYTWNTYGFRKDPYGSRVELSGAVATKGRGAFDLKADFRFENSPAFLMLNPFASSLEILNFYGVGNDSPAIPNAPKDFHDVAWTVLRTNVELGWDLGRLAKLSLGGAVNYSNTEDDPASFIAQFPGLYGTGGFVSTGGLIRFEIATDKPGLFELAPPETRGSFRLLGRLVPAVGDVTQTYGTAEGHGTATVPIGLRRSELGFRLGGKKVWGDPPWFDLAFIGGARSLRGWPVQRFAGDASLYGSGELRLDLFDYRLLFPSSFGVLGLFDLGRVWVDGESPGGFHTGYGGGIWMAIRGTRSILSVAFATSDEESGVYITMGFAY